MMQMPDFPMIITRLGTYDVARLRDHPEQEVALLQAGVAEVFESGGGLPMGAFVYTQHWPGIPSRRGADRVHLQLTEVNEGIKRAFSHALHGFVAATSAVAAGWASETWVAPCKGDEEMAEMRAWQRDHNGSLEGFRLTEERLTLAFETKSCMFWTNARIDRAGSTPKIGAWEATNYAAVEGRFAHLLRDIAPDVKA